MLLLQLPSLEEDRSATIQGDHLIAYTLKGAINLLNDYGFDILEAVVITKNYNEIPVKWRGGADKCYFGWTIHGALGGAMSILARKKPYAEES